MIWGFKDGELVQKGGSEEPQGMGQGKIGWMEQTVTRREEPNQALRGAGQRCSSSSKPREQIG
mgnify:FL=1